MFIDIHTHAYRIKPCGRNWATPEELIKRYDEMKVDMAVLLPIVSPEIYFTQPVEDILEMRDNYPDRFIAYCNVDPRLLWNSPYAPLDKIMEYYKNSNAKYPEKFAIEEI